MNACRAACGLLGFLLLATGCGSGGVDWNAPENFTLREKRSSKEGAEQLEYWSLIDAACQPIYDALVDVEHYPEFIPGVERSNLLAVTPTSKTVQIAQRVIARQLNAKVEWTFNPEKRQIAFKTLNSDLAYNDGNYELEPSPDGKRCLVRTTFTVKPAPGDAEQAAMLGALVQGTHDAYLAAAKGVKARATGAAK